MASKNSLKAKAPKKNRGMRIRKPQCKESYRRFIRKILHQIHPDAEISSKAMDIMNSFVNDIFERLATEASLLAQHINRKTLNSRDIQSSVALVLPDELAKYALTDGVKAVTKYTSGSTQK